MGLANVDSIIWTWHIIYSIHPTSQIQFEALPKPWSPVGLLTNLSLFVGDVVSRPLSGMTVLYRIRSVELVEYWGAF